VSAGGSEKNRLCVLCLCVRWQELTQAVIVYQHKFSAAYS